MKKRSFPSLPVLLVDDETAFLQSAAFILNSTNITNVVLCDDSRRVMPLLSEQAFSAIVLDMSMPNVTGGELLPQIVRDYPETPVLILTAVDEVITAVASMKAGAFDFLTKPVSGDELRARLELPELPAAGTYHTVGGLMLALLKRVPKEGDRIVWAGWRFEVVDIDGRRVDKVLASREDMSS